jgi:hypothetical protein
MTPGHRRSVTENRNGERLAGPATCQANRVRQPTGEQRGHRFADIASTAVVLNEEGRITGDHQLIEM